MPIYQSSTFAFESADQGAATLRRAPTRATCTPGWATRPSTRCEQAVCALEGGYAALGTASGMAAISTVLLTFLRSGDHVVGTDAVYGPTRLLLEKQLAKFGIESTWVPTERIEAVRTAARPNTRMIYIETPANPTIKLTDLRGLRRAGQGDRRAARRGQHVLALRCCSSRSASAPTSSCTA